VYRTKDGRHLALGAMEMKFWRAFSLAIGRPDLIDRHATGEGDQAALIEEIRSVFATRTRDEWLAFFGGHDVCLTPVNQPSEAFLDPHALSRGTVTRSAGLRAIRPPWLQNPAPLDPAPALGQHTAAILAGL